MGWPKEHGGRDLSLYQQVIWFEEYARAAGPGRLGHIGETLAGPTIIAFGSPEQQRALPARHPRRHRAVVRRATPSPTPAPTSPTCRPGPSATATSGSSTGRRCGRRWRTGRSGASCCAAPTARRPKHKGISYLLVPMRPGRRRDPAHPPGHRHLRVQRGVLRRRPHRGRPTSSAPGTTAGRSPWAPLAFERGASTLGQQLEFQNAARPRHRASPAPTVAVDDPVFRQRLADAWIGLQRHAVEHAARAVGGRRRARPARP